MLESSLVSSPSQADLPSLTTVTLLPLSFNSCMSLHTSSSLSLPPSHADIGALSQHPSFSLPPPNAVIITASGLQPLATSLTAITIAHVSGNDPKLTAVDFSPFKQAKTITIGNFCFRYVTHVTLKGMPSLERVEIGARSFQRCIHPSMDDVVFLMEDDERFEGQFCLKDCPKVKTLVLGNGAFHEAEKCVIEDVPALEEIVMSDWDNKYPIGCFKEASLELKSWDDGGR